MTKKRNVNLDGLKLLACFAVIGLHVLPIIIIIPLLHIFIICVDMLYPSFFSKWIFDFK